MDHRSPLGSNARRGFVDAQRPHAVQPTHGGGALAPPQEEINAKIRAAGNINDSFSAKNAALTARQNELRTLVTSLRAEVGDTRRQRESQQRETEALRKSLPYQTTEEIDRAIR